MRSAGEAPTKGATRNTRNATRETRDGRGEQATESSGMVSKRDMKFPEKKGAEVLELKKQLLKQTQSE